MIKLNPPKLRKDLAECQKLLERRPDSWFRREAVGRCLYWLRDPAAATYFQGALEVYPLSCDADAFEWKRIGGLWRLAGDAERAQDAFTHAYTLLQAGDHAEATLSLPDRIECSFFLNKDAEIQRMATALPEPPDPDLRVYVVVQLAHARAQMDVAQAEHAGEELAAMIKRSRARVYDTGAPTTWDWYEIAWRLARGLGADVPKDALP
jgi:tetratricopeptide (TPR) repeat protein